MDGFGEEDSQRASRIKNMTQKTLAVTIFLWCEVIVAIGVVLFYIVLFFNKFLTDLDFDLSVSDRFAPVPVFIALFYCVAAIAALCGHRLWPLLQYMVTVLAVLLTIAFSKTLQSMGRPFEFVYCLPLICSAFAASFVFIFQKYSMKKEKL